MIAVVLAFVTYFGVEIDKRIFTRRGK